MFSGVAPTVAGTYFVSLIAFIITVLFCSIDFVDLAKNIHYCNFFCFVRFYWQKYCFVFLCNGKLSNDSNSKSNH